MVASHGHAKIVLVLLKPDPNVYQRDDREHAQSIALEKGQDAVACRMTVRSSSSFFWRDARILGLEIHSVAPSCVKRHFRIAPVQLVAAGGRRGSSSEGCLPPSPLNMALWSRRFHLAAQHLMLYGDDPDTKDCRGRTPLQRAARSGYDHLVEIFIKGQADMESRDLNGEASLFWRCRETILTCARWCDIAKSWS